MHKCLLSFAMVCGLIVVSSPLRAECTAKPKLDPIFRDEGASVAGNPDYMVVDGHRWTHVFYDIASYGVLPDCRVLVVERRGLDFFVVINDVSWKNSVYNSAFVMTNKDGSTIVQVSPEKGYVVVNDEVHRVPGMLQQLRFNERNQLEVKVLDDNKQEKIITLD